MNTAAAPLTVSCTASSVPAAPPAVLAAAPPPAPAAATAAGGAGTAAPVSGCRSAAGAVSPLQPSSAPDKSDTRGGGRSHRRSPETEGADVSTNHRAVSGEFRVNILGCKFVYSCCLVL